MTPEASELGALMPSLLEVLTNARMGVEMIIDRGGEFLWHYVNAPAAAIFGYTVDELYAVRPIDTMIPGQRELVSQLSANFRAGGPLPPALELEVLHKDGTHVPIEVVLGVGKAGDDVAYVMLIRDIGLQQQAQLSLLEADRIGLVGALAAGFAHQINNPLTSVLLNLRALRKQLLANLGEAAQPAALRCLDDITAGSERIASSVRALQTLATRSATRPLDLAALVSAALRLAAPTLDPVARVIRQIYPVDPVNAEESRVGQAVLAMLLFSSSGFDGEVATQANRIVVCVEQRDRAVVVEVSDNGRDLSPEEAGRAFDPFFRSTVRGAGVGVGLGVARSVAATLGGEVTLAPRPGGGAMITMRLPVA
jgi:two-component system NtrC family sensor kinase